MKVDLQMMRNCGNSCYYYYVHTLYLCVHVIVTPLLSPCSFCCSFAHSLLFALLLTAHPCSLHCSPWLTLAQFLGDTWNDEGMWFPSGVCLYSGSGTWWSLYRFLALSNVQFWQPQVPIATLRCFCSQFSLPRMMELFPRGGRESWLLQVCEWVGGAGRTSNKWSVCVDFRYTVVLSKPSPSTLTWQSSLVSRLDGCRDGTYTMNTHDCTKSGDDCDELDADWSNPVISSTTLRWFPTTLVYWAKLLRPQGTSVVRNFKK